MHVDLQSIIVLFCLFVFLFAGKTALHWAAAVDDDNSVKVLLSRGANRDAQNKNDETPLLLATRGGCCKSVKLLLQNSASCEIGDNMNRLPRDIAAERNYTDIVELLDDYPKTSFALSQSGSKQNHCRKTKKKRQPGDRGIKLPFQSDKNSKKRSAASEHYASSCDMASS